MQGLFSTDCVHAGPVLFLLSFLTIGFFSPVLEIVLASVQEILDPGDLLREVNTQHLLELTPSPSLAGLQAPLPALVEPLTAL